MGHHERGECRKPVKPLRSAPRDSSAERYGSSTLKPDSIMPAHNTSSKPVDHLTPDEARAEHEALGAEIAEHDRRYYEEDAPSVSDAEYDALRKRYEALEDQFPELKSPESLTQKVGSKVSEKFGKVRRSEEHTSELQSRQY